MKLIALGLSDAVDVIRTKLTADCSLFESEGYTVVIKEQHLGKYTFLNCHLADSEVTFFAYDRIKQLLRLYVAQIVTDLIVEDKEPHLLQQMLNSDHNYFSLEEQQQVLSRTQTKLADGDTRSEFKLSTRRGLILSELSTYLEQEQELVVDGFIRFRLAAYEQVLRQALNEVATECMAEIEYQEFVQVLRHFVGMQQQRSSEVHVIVDSSGSISVFDAEGELLREGDGEPFIANALEDSNGQDLLLSALVSLVPSAIVLHLANHNHRNLVSCIQDVFTERVIICNGCYLCSQAQLDLLDRG